MTEPSQTAPASAPAKRTRMSAAERRSAILEAATAVFANSSYASATTAAIARQAGISEPVLYHHFRNKADLYTSCLDAAWAELKPRWDAVLKNEPDAANWMGQMAEIGLTTLSNKRDTANLWMHAMTDLAEDPEAREHVVKFNIEVHEYISSVVAAAQDAGSLAKSLDPRAEAWIFLSLGVLHAISRRLGGIVDKDFEKILDSRHAWYAIHK